MNDNNLENFLKTTDAEELDDAALSIVVGGDTLNGHSFEYNINLLGPSIEIDLTLRSVDLSETIGVH